MSLNKAIQHGKEKREPYCGCKAVDATCRNHGSCGICLSNRMHSTNKRTAAQFSREKEFKQNDADT